LSTCLVVVEGESDEGFVEGMAERLGIRCRVCRMRGNKPNKIGRIIRSFSGLRKAIVLKDLHGAGRDVNTLINKFRNLINQLRSNGIEAHLIIVKRSIESWVLAGMCVEDAENLPDPEEKLMEVMRRRGEDYIKSKTLLRKLARELDIEKIMKVSNSFRNFIEALRNHN